MNFIVGAATPHPEGNTGPSPGLEQSWTPDAVVDLLWNGLAQCGFHPQRFPVVHDLAAGYGKLVDRVDHMVQLVLNDIDPELTQVLKRRFPRHRVTTGDFRNVNAGRIVCAVGSPPWINDHEGEYLPHAFLVKLVRHMVPGAVAGLVLPDWFFPEIEGLRPLMTLRPTDEQLGWARSWSQRPTCSFYTRV